MNTQLNECPRCHRQYYDERITNDLCNECERYLEWEEIERERIQAGEDNLQHDCFDSRDYWDRWEDYE